jgi:hypothetical protein
LENRERKNIGVKQQRGKKRKGVRAQWTPNQIQHVDPKYHFGEDFGMTTYREINFLPSHLSIYNGRAKNPNTLAINTIRLKPR